MRISDWSSDVCSSDLLDPDEPIARLQRGDGIPAGKRMILDRDMLMRTMAFCCPGLIAQHIARSLAEIGPWCPDRSLFLARPPGHAAENLLYDIFRIFMPLPSREIGRGECRERWFQ